jgi:RNA polymerase sigma-32 factor
MSTFPTGNIVPDEDDISSYIRKIQKYPLLDSEEEFTLAKKWVKTQDPEAASKLITSHLRLVTKIAAGYRGYGLPMSELIAEGNIGIMQAIKRYDPDLGHRFSTYAMWWIKAAMQEYILKSWSLVKVGTTAAQKKLFFNLRRMKHNMNLMNGEKQMNDAHIKKIAKELGVKEEEVKMMNQRMAGNDRSLNATVKSDEDSLEWQDWLETEEENQEERTINKDKSDKESKMLEECMKILSPREYEIIKYRRLSEPPLTLEDLAQQFRISKERVRQLENRAFAKIQKAMINEAKKIGYHESI